MITTHNVKRTGTYYTPPTLSDFMIFHLFTKYSFGKKISILEPSSGDGVFFDSIFNNGVFRNRKEYIQKAPKVINVTAVETSKSAIEESKRKTAGYVTKSKRVHYINKDYLQFHKTDKQKYDLVVGNPPYIKRNYLTAEQIKLSNEIHKNAGLENKEIKNIWTSFLIAGVDSLNENGVLCFVLPAELLQVIYARELRHYLRSQFQKIEIFTFNDVIFDDIEQDVVILICGKNRPAGVSFYNVDKLDDLKEPLFVTEHSNIHRTTLDKWTNYVLSDGELKFLEKIRSKLLKIKDYCKAEVGIVTAANEFFIVDKKTVDKFDLRRYAKPILQKASFMAPTLNFSTNDQKMIEKTGNPSFFINFDNKKKGRLTNSARKYLKRGELLMIHKRYKTLLRDNWYAVPSFWISEGFFAKRSNLFPRMAINSANSAVTDAFYRIKMKPRNKIKDLVFSFYNTLTFIFAELEGRYYGGSVLELTPNEYKNLAVPYVKDVRSKDLETLDKMLREEASVRDILAFSDNLMLKKHLKLSQKEVRRLNQIYAKLVKRRLKKNNLSGF